MAMQPMQQQGQGGDPAHVLKEMILSTDQAITQISQVIGKQIPEAGEALAEVGAQFRAVIESVMDMGQGGGRSRQSEGQQVPAEVGASRGARQAM